MTDLTVFLRARLTEAKTTAAEQLQSATDWLQYVVEDCDAKARIVGLHGAIHDCVGSLDHASPTGGGYIGCDTLRLLALPFATHPDYRGEWRP